MPSPVIPSDICDVVPSATSALCDRIEKVLLRFPKLVCDLESWRMNEDGTASDAFKLSVMFSNLFCTATGADTYIASSPDVATIYGTDYGDGVSRAVILPVKFLNSNTGAATLNLNGSGAFPIRKNVTEDLGFGDIASSSIHILIFDRTQWQIVSPLQASTGSRSQVITSGSGNFTVPSSVYAIDVECIGAGGGGGGKVGATGGGGGGYCCKRMVVAPGDVLAYSVGAAGVASTGNNATDGGDTTFSTLFAGGGKNGDSGSGVAGIASNGDITINGSDGYDQGDGRGALDKCEGGMAGHAFGAGGWRTSSGTDHPPTGYGGGGFGDVDASGGWQSSNGGSGVIIIRW